MPAITTRVGIDRDYSLVTFDEDGDTLTVTAIHFFSDYDRESQGRTKAQRSTLTWTMHANNPLIDSDGIDVARIGKLADKVHELLCLDWG